VKFFLCFFLFSSAVLHGQQSLPPGAQSPDEPATQTAPPPKTATVSQELAGIEDKIAGQQYEAARPSLLHYLQTHADDARAQYDLGFLDAASGDEAGAETNYRKAIAADPQQFESRLALGLLLAQRGTDAEAHEQLKAATERSPAPGNPALQAQALRALAELDITMGDKGDPAEAKQAMLDALKLSPETLGDLLLTARIAAANGDPDTEQAAYRRLLARQPDSVEGLAGLAHVLLQLKRYDEAEPLVRQALTKIPDDPGLNMQLASILAAEGKPEESIAALEKLHAAEPGNTAVDQMLADAYLAAHQSDKAEPLLASLLKAKPDDMELLDAEGQALTRAKRYPEAAAVFNHATTLHPEDVDALNGLAFTESELHEDEAALKTLATRAKLAHDTPVTLFLWATSYDRLRQARPAADYYQKFLAAANGKFPDQEWQARHRLVALGQAH
jgi:tetratricopeptide (TPR) repeat protein